MASVRWFVYKIGKASGGSRSIAEKGGAVREKERERRREGERERGGEIKRK